MNAEICNGFPFSRLRKKVPEGRMRVLFDAITVRAIDLKRFNIHDRSCITREICRKTDQHPHPALRATFSRKREKGKNGGICSCF